MFICDIRLSELYSIQQNDYNLEDTPSHFNIAAFNVKKQTLNIIKIFNNK